MTFELYIKGTRAKVLGEREIRIGRASISFGSEICKELKVKGFVEVYLDRENNRVGFLPSESSMRGFCTPERTKSKSLYLASKTFAGLLPVGAYETKKEDDMWVIKVPEIATKK